MSIRIEGPYFDAMWQKLAECADYLLRFLRSDQKLRDEQSANAPLAQGFQQGTITDAAVTVFDAAQDGVTKFTYMVVVLEDSASECRYTQDASAPSAAGRGTQAPSTGTGFTITIVGAENIQRFKIIAISGGTAPFTMQGFR